MIFIINYSVIKLSMVYLTINETSDGEFIVFDTAYLQQTVIQ